MHTANEVIDSSLSDHTGSMIVLLPVCLYSCSVWCNYYGNNYIKLYWYANCYINSPSTDNQRKCMHADDEFLLVAAAWSAYLITVRYNYKSKNVFRIHPCMQKDSILKPVD